MTREEIILSHIKRHCLGLEIGAGCAPIAPKKQGFRVHVLDHCDRKALIENIDRTGSTSTTSRRLISFGTAGLTPSSSAGVMFTTVIRRRVGILHYFVAPGLTSGGRSIGIVEGKLFANNRPPESH
jgi:hypothetical protein